MTLGEKILFLRKKAGISQEQLADELSVSRQAISKWELNESMPDTKNMLQLGELFNASMDYLFKEDIDNPQKTNANGLSILQDCAQNTNNTNDLQQSKKVGKRLKPILLITCLALSFVFCVVSISSLIYAMSVFNGRETGYTYYTDLITYGHLGDDITLTLSGESSAVARGGSVIFGQEDIFFDLPQIYTRTININTLETSFKLIPYESLTYAFDRQDIIKVEGGKIIEIEGGLKDYSVNVEVSYNESGAANNNKEEIDINNGFNISEILDKKMSLIINVYKNFVAANSVSLKLLDGTTQIKACESKVLRLTYLPQNASQTPCDIYVEKILSANGETITENLYDYAYIFNSYTNNYPVLSLAVTNNVLVGSQIFIKAELVDNRIISNTLCLEVIKTPTTDASIFYNLSDSVPFAQTVTLYMLLYPTNCTANLENLPITIEMLTPEYGTLTKQNNRTYTLEVTDKIEYARECIIIKVTEDESSFECKLYIEVIDVESTALYNRATYTEMPRESTISRGSQIELYGVMLPVNATAIVSINYVCDVPNSSIYIELTSSGILGILKIKSDTPIGINIYLSVTAYRTSSGAYKITITE